MNLDRCLCLLMAGESFCCLAAERARKSLCSFFRALRKVYLVQGSLREAVGDSLTESLLCTGILVPMLAR